MEDPLIKQSIKLPHPVPGFTFFAQDQVLTADQLNQLIHYLDFQERQTRAWLIGTGIICGLEINMSNAAVEISPGCGLTSDGDLITLTEKKTFTHFGEFKDEEALYEPFAGVNKHLELREDNDGEGTKKLTGDTLKNKVVVLYKESYVKKPDFCTTENCDNQGLIQQNQLRVLLLPKNLVNPLAPSLTEIAHTLPEPRATRPDIQKGPIQKLEDSGGKSGLQSRFTNAISGSRESVLDFLKQLKKNLETLQPFLPGGLSWGSKIPAVPKPATEVFGLQHIHAFYLDLCQGLREWRASLLKIQHSCVPDLDQNPKHLLLGETVDTPDHPPHPYRHRFVAAGSIPGSPGDLKRPRLLWQRLEHLTAAFDRTPETDGIKILPSRNPGEALGKRARPAYYGKDYQGYWDIDSYLERGETEARSYFNTPTSVFDTSDWETDFYRIEGHLGKTVASVEARLKNLRREYNLSFQILAIQIDDDPRFAILRPYRFFDLETAYYDHRTKLKLQLRDVDAFASKIGDSLDEGQDRIADASAGDISATRSAAGKVNVHAKAAESVLPARMSLVSEDQIATFSTSYLNAVDQSHIVNKTIGSIAGQVQMTPLDRFVQPEISAGWKLWFDRLQKRKRKVAELSTFEKFVEQNHGLEHLGGVPRGGTFVIVYSASEDPEKQIVKADFCLPYYSYFDLNSLEEEEEPVEPDKPTTIMPFIPEVWPKIYDWKVTELTPLTVSNLVLKEAQVLEGTLAAQLDGKIQQNFQAFEFFTDFGRGTTGDLGTGGLDLGVNDPQLDLLVKEMDANRAAIDRLTAARDAGSAPPNVDKMIENHEKSYVEAAKSGIGLVAMASGEATATNRKMDEGHLGFMTKVASEGFAFKTDTGRSALVKAVGDLETKHQDDPVMVDSLKRIAGAVQVL